jgi:hypothetical protein
VIARRGRAGAFCRREVEEGQAALDGLTIKTSTRLLGQPGCPTFRRQALWEAQASTLDGALVGEAALPTHGCMPAQPLACGEAASPVRVRAQDTADALAGIGPRDAYGITAESQARGAGIYARGWDS